MDAKKLIEGLPIRIHEGKVASVSGNYFSVASITDRLPQLESSPYYAINVEALGWRVLLALMDEQEPEWKVGDEFIYNGKRDRIKAKGRDGLIDTESGQQLHVTWIVPAPPPQEQPRDFFSGPEWDEKWDRKYVPDDAVAVGLARARSIRKAIDYLLAKEKP
ncbi:MAG: hypothetical protein KGL39_55300 [Patescibacteria group bacterium]|nr:hypothetical protein [Patescibacteria group bacterium]